MKYLFLMIGVAISLTVMGQDEDMWINRTYFVETEDCIDSVNCYNEVFIDVNMNAIADSSFIRLHIGSTPGGGEIYDKRYQNTSALFLEPNVSKSEDNVATFNLGKFIVTEEFFVDMNFE